MSLDEAIQDALKDIHQVAAWFPGAPMQPGVALTSGDVSVKILRVSLMGWNGKEIDQAGKDIFGDSVESVLVRKL